MLPRRVSPREACVHVIPDLHHHIIADQSFFSLVNILRHMSQFIHPPKVLVLPYTFHQYRLLILAYLNTTYSLSNNWQASEQRIHFGWGDIIHLNGYEVLGLTCLIYTALAFQCSINGPSTGLCIKIVVNRRGIYFAGRSLRIEDNLCDIIILWSDIDVPQPYAGLR